MTINWKALADALTHASRVVLTTHVDPDGDAMGALLGLGRALRLHGVPTRLLAPGAVSPFWRFLPEYEQLSPTNGSTPQELREDDVLVVLDAPTLSRSVPLLLDQHTLVVNIDHHTTNDGFGHVHAVDPSAAATCELVALFLTETGLPVDKGVATCLMVGLVTDTHCFRTSSVTSRTLRVGARLVDAGAPLSHIVEQVFLNKSLTTLRLWGMALNSLQARNGVVWTAVTQGMLDACNATMGDVEGLVDLLASVREAEAALLFKEGRDHVKVSLRTSGRVDAGQIAAVFQGGGHPRAAGCSVRGTLRQAEEQVLPVIFATIAGTNHRANGHQGQPPGPDAVTGELEAS